MAKSANQKSKLLYLSKILLEQTDEDHPITVPEMIQELAKRDRQLFEAFRLEKEFLEDPV